MKRLPIQEFHILHGLCCVAVVYSLEDAFEKMREVINKNEFCMKKRGVLDALDRKQNQAVSVPVSQFKGFYLYGTFGNYALYRFPVRARQ